MGCSTSTQTSAVDTSRPSAKPEEINGATVTGAAGENGNVAEDSETIPDQTPAPVGDATEPVAAAACTESTVEAVPAEKEPQHAAAALATDTATAEATPTEAAATPAEATPTEAATPAEATPTEAATPAEATPTEAATPAEATPTEAATPAEATPTEAAGSVEAPAAETSAASQQGTGSEPRTEEAPAPSD
ncbi:classical arabinogalactan protein 4 isoform X1 [Takifugu rubripes]|uniref:classical arabinogalactan protein 4 isoform X1 n=1 Tax=Takifugu rubripes TaxID=31033 RepID=UPI0011455210|nr:classical arabinogalactan protein 4-like isoform X1 [Takifugu rubripes]